jgi:hypothetical protein
MRILRNKIFRRIKQKKRNARKLRRLRKQYRKLRNRFLRKTHRKSHKRRSHRRLRSRRKMLNSEANLLKNIDSTLYHTEKNKQKMLSNWSRNSFHASLPGFFV